MSTKAALYLRLSKEDLKKENQYSESIENQRLLLSKYASDNDFEIEGIYIDDDFSGLNSARPQFNKMIEDARQKKFTVILCKNQSRFSRDAGIIEKYLHNLFILWGIRFIGVVDNIDTGVSGGKKSRQINSLINEWYCEDISENVKAALKAKKNQGQYLGHWCPYGYQLAPGDKHKIIIDKNTAPVVKKIFELASKGYSPYETAAALTEDKIDTPTFYKMKSGINYYNPSFSGKNIWSQNTVRKILKDKTYIGHLVQGRQKKISYKINKVVDVPQSQWIICENNHAPIIDPLLYNEVQIKLRQRSAKRTRNSKRNILSGKLFCGHCGAVLKIHYNSGNIYFLCTNKDCFFKSIRSEWVLDWINNEISELFQPENSALACALNTYVLEKFSQTSKEMNNDSKQLATYKISLSNLYIDYSSGIIPIESYKIISKDLEDRIKNLENKLNRLQARREKHNTAALIQNVTANKYIITELIEKIHIEKNNDTNIKIHIFWLF